LRRGRDAGPLKRACGAADTRCKGTFALKIDILVPRATVPPASGPGTLVPPVRPAEVVRPVGKPLALANLVADGELGAALRRELPRQGSPMPLLANLAWLNATPEGERAALPEPVRQAVAAAWRALAALDELARPGEFERAAQSSGLGLERLLANADSARLETSLAGDWKALLLRLRAALEAVPRRPATGSPARTDAPLPGRPGAMPALEPVDAQLPELPDPAAMAGVLAEEVDAAVARITSHQLANLRDPALAPTFIVEIPVRDGHGATLLRLRFTRGDDGQSGAPDGPAWSVEFAVHLGAAGALQGSVQLTGRRVDVVVESGVAAMLDALRAAEAELRWHLESLGLEIGQLGWRAARPPAPDSGSRWLVDERA
jgi:hypothetical protein